MAADLPIEIDHDGIAAFCRRSHIVRLSFFGSVLRDDFTPESDVDVLVEFEPEMMPSLFGMARMQRELGEIIGRTVDFKTKGFLSQYIRDDVVGQAREEYVA
jgi:predicted nucleotidyltransferase